MGTRLIFDRPSPVKLACQGCRSGHQKCDGVLPICSRCKKEQKTCDYTPSRRGRAVAHLHKKSVKFSRSNNVDCSPETLQKGSLTIPTTAFEETSAWAMHKSLEESPLVCMNAERNLITPVDLRPTNNTSILNPYYLSVFYSRFWPAHPFLPPFMYIEGHFDKIEGNGLRSAVNFLGFKYSHETSDPPLSLEAPRRFLEYSDNGLSVQALMLLAISYHMTNNREQAQLALDAAARIALNIGLDKKSFAFDHGGGVPSIEESWRRTWWELYILDVMFAAINQTACFHLKDVHLEVQLPCEEATYRTAGVLPKPQSLKEFDVRFFRDDKAKYSSFSYRIAAARALSKIISVSVAPQMPMSTLKREAELEVENLVLHLPKHMQTYVDSEGDVDEIAFQVHMIINAGIIYLHRPQSLLTSPNPNHTITCAPNQSVIHSDPIQHHTRKTVDAANEVCNMISLSSALMTHTPFFVCAVAMQAIVHLGIYRMPTWRSKQRLAEEQIKMSIGALRKLSEVWEMADVVRHDIKNVARTLLEVHKDSRSSGFKEAQENDSAPFWEPEQASISQPNEDSWIDEFLAVSAAR